MASAFFIVAKQGWEVEDEKNHISKLEKLISETKCQRDFLCQKPGFENLPKVKNFGIRDFVDVIEVEEHEPCKFLLPFGY